MSMRAYYFGCTRGVWGHTQAGHCFYLPGGESFRPHGPYAVPEHAAVANGWYGIGPWGSVDGKFAPRERDSRRALELPQGRARLHHKDGWTALSFWDRTGDSRGASSSTFFFDAELDFDSALASAREHFPELFERFDFEVTEVAH